MLRTKKFGLLFPLVRHKPTTTVTARRRLSSLDTPANPSPTTLCAVRPRMRCPTLCIRLPGFGLCTMEDVSEAYIG